jgi:hypothetical protein
MLRLRRKLDSETLHLPELKPLIGRTVEITVEEQAPDGCFQDSTPAQPLESGTKEALRALLTQEQFEALMDVVDAGGPSIDAIRKLRAASMT